jgi:outer membrane protein OmpA-like peptidoglycan-associated protein
MRRLAMLSLMMGLAGCTTVPAPTPAQSYVVFFAEWSAALDNAGLSVVSNAATAAKTAPAATVTVVGYADPTGSAQANIDISRTRAQQVTDQLVLDGIAPNRIQQVARGITGFAGTSQESRRVEINIGG